MIVYLLHRNVIALKLRTEGLSKHIIQEMTFTTNQTTTP